MTDKKRAERKTPVVKLDCEDFRVNIEIAKYVEEYTDILDVIRLQRKCLDLVDEISSICARAYSVKFDKDWEKDHPQTEQGDVIGVEDMEVEPAEEPSKTKRKRDTKPTSSDTDGMPF